MEKLTKNELLNSLSFTSNLLENYIPELFKGLWELGSMPEYIIELIGRNIPEEFNNVIDLGCGKGAVLIQLAKQLDIKGIGVDIISEFIDEANNFAAKNAVSEKVDFKTEDLLETIKSTSDQDIVIYGYDSEILGDLNNTLKLLSKCVKDGGFIILELMVSDKPSEDFITESEMTKTIEDLGIKLIDRIYWSRETLIQTNRHNTEIINGNVKRLSELFPDKRDLFQEFLQNQMAECEELENDYICMTLLLKINELY